MLKTLITEAEYQTLSDESKGHYLRRADGSYTVSLSGELPVVAELRARVGELGSELASERTRAATLENDAKAVEARVEGAYKAKLDASAKELTELRLVTSTSARDAVVNAIANRFTTPSLFQASIRERVQAQYNEQGVLEVKCFDSKGAEITQEALTTEYCNNKEYSAMIKQTNSVTITQPNVANTFTQPNQQQQQHVTTSALQRNSMGQITGVDIGAASDADMVAAITAMQSNNNQS